MASNSPPDIDRRNSTADSSISIEILRYITNASGEGNLPQHVEKLFSCLSELVSQLLPGITSSSSASHKDVYTNETFLNLLRVITGLGSCAKSDLEKCLDSSQDVTVNPVEPLPLEDRWQVLDSSISACRNQLQQLESSPLVVRCLQKYTDAVKLLKSNRFTAGPDASAMDSSLIQHQQLEAWVEALRAQIMREVEVLAVSCDCLDDVMKKWRRVDAWIYGRIIPASTDKIDSALCKLDSIFRKYFDILTIVTRLSKEVADDTTAAVRKKIYEIQNKVHSVGWHMNQKLQRCVLELQQISMSVRTFVLQKKDIEAVDIYIFPESDYNERHNVKYQYTNTKPEIVDSGSKGAIVTVRNLKLKKCERAQKRNYATCCEQFYRVSFLVRLQSVDRQCVEWLSTPFSVRTGSQQRWECEGAVIWYCFAAQDLYGQTFKYQTEMSIAQLLAMLQAMVFTVDPDKKLDCDEMEAFADMLHTLTKTDNVNLLDFVKRPMPKQGREKSGQNEFPCFTWFMAALNTHKYLKENTNLRDCSDFAGYDQVIKNCGGKFDRSAWIRISRNEVEVPGGQSPHAHVVVHVHTASGVKTLLVSHTKLIKRALSSRLRNWRDCDGKRLVLTIQPCGLPIEKLDNFKEQPVQVNSYRTQFKTQTTDFVLEGDFEKMHIRDDRANRDESDSDLTVNDSSKKVPAKRARIHTNKSSAVTNRQPQSPPSADNSCLSSDIPGPSIDTCEELYASISTPLPDDMFRLYLKPFMPGNIQQQSHSQTGISDASSISALSGNIQLLSHSQPGISDASGISALSGNIQLLSHSQTGISDASGISALSGNIQPLSHSQPGISNASGISALSENIQPLSHSQPGISDASGISALSRNIQLNPVPDNEENLSELLDHCLNDDER